MAALVPEIKYIPVHCTPDCRLAHQHRPPNRPTCHHCDRSLYTWAGPGHPMPHHYQAIPGVGTWCPGPTHLPCAPCLDHQHRSCSGQGCYCRNLHCSGIRRGQGHG